LHARLQVAIPKSRYPQGPLSPKGMTNSYFLGEGGYNPESSRVSSLLLAGSKFITYIKRLNAQIMLLNVCVGGGDCPGAHVRGGTCPGGIVLPSFWTYNTTHNFIGHFPLGIAALGKSGPTPHALHYTARLHFSRHDGRLHI